MKTMLNAALGLALMTVSAGIADAQTAPLVVPMGDKVVLVQKLTLKADEHFAFDSADLTLTAKGSLDAVLAAVAPVPTPLLLVTGHTDRLGTEAYNTELSLRRATAVAQYLRDKGGLRTGTVGVAAMGESQPVVLCPDQTGDALKACLAPNRRVEVVFTALQSVSDPSLIFVEEIGTPGRSLGAVVGIDESKIKMLE